MSECGHLSAATSTIDGAVLEACRQWPDRPALLCPDTDTVELTFKQLADLVHDVSSTISTVVTTNAPIGVLGEGAVATVAILAVMSLDIPYVPIDSRHPTKKLKQARVSTLLATGSTVPKAVTQAVSVLELPSLADLAARKARFKEHASTEGSVTSSKGSVQRDSLFDGIAYVMFTSGSTGGQKAVLGTHAGMINRFKWMWQHFPFVGSDVAIQKTSYAFLDSVYETFGALAAGVPVAVMPVSVRRGNAAQYLQFLCDHRVTRLVVVPSLLRLLLAAFQDSTGLQCTLRYVTCSGEPLTRALFLHLVQCWPDVTAINCYGCTEVSADALYWTGDSDSKLATDSLLVPIGKPIPNVEAHLVCMEDKTKLAEPGSLGTLVIAGVAVAKGYLGTSPADRQFDPISDLTSLHCFSTGDLAIRLEDGSYQFVGRVDGLRKVRGQRINLMGVEAYFAKQSDIKRACAVTVGSLGSEVLVVCVTPSHVDTRTLRMGAKGALPSAMVPTHVLAMKQLPTLASSGKISRQRLERKVVKVLSERAKGEKMQDGDLGRLQEYITKLLGCNSLVSVRIPLVDLGLTSVNAMAMWGYLESNFNLPAHIPFDILEDLSLHELFDKALGDKTATLLERPVDSPDSPLVPGGMACCATGASAEVLACFDAGWDPRRVVDRRGSTALMWAAGEGHLPIVELLFEKCPDLDPNQTNKAGRTALMQAAKAGHTEIFRFLVDAGADIRLRSNDGSTTFHWAVHGGYLTMVETIFAIDPAMAQWTNDFGCSAVHWAAAAGHLEVCKWLMTNDFDFHLLNRSNHGALEAAAWKGHRHVVEWCLTDASGPGLHKQLQLLDQEGRTVADLCREAGHAALATLLETDCPKSSPR